MFLPFSLLEHKPFQLCLYASGLSFSFASEILLSNKKCHQTKANLKHAHVFKSGRNFHHSKEEVGFCSLKIN